MNQILNKRLFSWFISYDVYTDIFQMFDEQIYHVKSDSLYEKDFKRWKFVFEKSKNEPLLIEIPNGYHFFGKDANAMLKSEIINKLSPVLESYAKQS